ncbi:hypothetical protein RPSD_52350 (plasmid) [Ralstonia solanacearum]|nr:hypothetical protein RPSD_52350 [Ralstonia solanacearum]
MNDVNVYFDNNTLPEVARAGLDLVSALAGSKYVVSVTPDLATEYRQAIANERVPLAEKELCQRLLSAAEPRGIFGFAEGGNCYSGFDYGVWATDGMVKTIQSITVTERPGKEIPKNRTDAFLAALADGAVIITNDGGSHFKRARAGGQHVYSWAEIADVTKAPSDVALDLGRLLALQLLGK